MKTTLEVLTEGRTFLSDRSNWMQGNLEDGRGRYCAVGAICSRDYIMYDQSLHPASDEAWKALDRAAQDLYGVRAPIVNDDHGYEAVMRVYDRAIANERAKAQEFDVTPVPAEPIPALAETANA